MQIKHNNLAIYKEYGFELRQSIKPAKPVKPEKQKKSIKPEKQVKLLHPVIDTFCRMVPPARKALSGFDDYRAGNYIMAAGMGFRAWNEHKEEFKEIKAVFKNEPYRKDWQHPFWFVQGCEIEKMWIGKKLVKYDKTLFDLKPVKRLLLRAGMIDYNTGIHDFHKINGSKAAKFLGTSALRFPVLGAVLYTVMELDHIRKSDHKIKDTVLAPVRVATIIGCASLGGAAGRYGGRITEFLGMGTGIIIGCKIAKDYLMAGKAKPKKPKSNKKLNILI